MTLTPQEFSAVSKQILEEVQKAQSILLHLHPSPDHDSIGSSLALYHVLIEMGKKVTIISGDSTPRTVFSYVPGFDCLTRNNYSEIDTSKYDLFLIVDSGSAGQISSKGEVVFPQTMKTVCVDHHASNTGFADINLIDSTSPAAAQVVYLMLKEWGVNINQETALCLMLGIYGDTGGFRYPLTSHVTFQAATELSKIAPHYTLLIANVEEHLRPQEIRLLSMGLGNIKSLCGGRLLVTGLSKVEMEAVGITADDAQMHRIPEIMRSTDGCEIAISLLETETGKVKVGLRSKIADVYDTSLVALELKGGGHRTSSGARVTGTITEAEEKVLSAVRKFYPEFE
ncbi:MAG: bifunctional oligoribonuclease/PAP phosphatase NrnA [Candidatus Paceibacterota bacterium]|jgi:phosphoesterase RecJ-like protein